jgi:hypothetical protein
MHIKIHKIDRPFIMKLFVSNHQHGSNQIQYLRFDRV